MPDDLCSEYARLEAEAHATLKKLGALAEAQIRALDARNDKEFTRLDHELEWTVGHKERVIGALRAHASAHGCQREFLPEL